MVANRILAMVALAALAVGMAAYGQTPPKKPRHTRVAVETPAQKATREAEAAIDEKDYATAEGLLLPAVAANPKDYRAWFDLGVVYAATHRRAEALDAYRKALAAQPDLFEASLNLGILLAQAGSPEAERYLRAATQMKPSERPDEGRARAWLSLGHALADKDPAQASEAYSQAARLQPKNPEPHLGAALLLERQDKLVEAAQEFEQAAALAPASEEALAGLANVYTRLGKLVEAEAALRKVIARNPQNIAAHLQFGRVLLAQKRAAEARASFETALELSPEDPDLLRQVAGLDLAAGNYDAAARRFRVLVQRNPDDPELRHALGNTLMNQRSFAEAQQELLIAVKLKPDLAEAYGDLAVAANGNQNYQLTIQALDTRARYLPESAGTYFLRATAYDHLKAFPQAVELYKQFLAAAGGRYPDQEWQARHRLIAIDPEKKK